MSELNLNIQYPTKERKYINDNVYQNVYKRVELPPVKIVRHSCGRGAAKTRYHYEAYFKAPIDAKFPYDGLISTYIRRKENKHFKPKSLDFIEDVAVIENEANQ